MALSLRLYSDDDDDGINPFTSSSLPRPSYYNNNGCNAMAMEGWMIFIEGGQYIFNYIPIIWTRWPTDGGIVIISGRALIVVVVVLLFEGGIDVVVDAI